MIFKVCKKCKKIISNDGDFTTLNQYITEEISDGVFGSKECYMCDACIEEEEKLLEAIFGKPKKEKEEE